MMIFLNKRRPEGAAMLRFTLLLLIVALAGCASPRAPVMDEILGVSPPSWPLQVVVSEVVPGVKKAYLEDQRGVPFLWNADTCWFLTFNATDEEVVAYLDDRSMRGVNVVQTMLLPWPNREEADSWFDVYPFVDGRFDQPNERYWEHVDFVVQAARERGITLVAALAWSGCCGEGWRDHLRSAENRADDFAALREYAAFVGERYRDDGNLIVFIGGDSSDNNDAFRAMGNALKEVAPEMLVAYHSGSWFCGGEGPCMQSSTAPGQHGQADFLDVSWTYTYWPDQNDRAYVHPYWVNHVEWNRNQRVPEEVSKVRPFLLGESGYEEDRGSPVNRIRRLMHWSILAGGSGHAYGHDKIWKLAPGWQDELDDPGSRALGHIADLYGARRWWELVPEQPRSEVFVGEPLTIAGAQSFILSGQAPYDNVASLDEARGRSFVAAARTPDGRLLMAYFPHHYDQNGIEIDMTALSGPATVIWADPHGEEHVQEESPLPNRGSRLFSPPGNNSFGDGDWLLILEVEPR